MPKYQVQWTRDTSESCTIEVEAADSEEAIQKSYAALGGEKLPDGTWGNFPLWEPDDWAGKAYLSDPDTYPELIEEGSDAA